MKTRAILNCLFIVAALGAISQASATTRTWTGAGANNFWTNAANWNGGLTAPAPGDALVFPGSGVDATSLNNTNTFPDKTPFASITLSGSNYVLNGASVYFTNSSVIAIDAANPVGTNTVNLGFLFDTASQSVACDSSPAVLILNGDIDMGPVAGSANCIGEIRLSGSVSGGTSLSKNGAGKLVMNSPVNNSYGGSTAVNAGAVELNGASPMIPGTLVISSGATVTLLAANQIGFGTAGNVTVSGTGLLNLNGFSDGIGTLTLSSGGDVVTGAGTLTLGGNVTATAAAADSCTISGNLSLGSATRTFTVNNATIDPDLEITAVISASAGVGLTKSGAGQMRLSATNTYAGDTTVSAGILRVNGAQSNSRVLLSGGTLAGTGTVGEIAGAGSGTVSPGASPGTLTSSNLVLGAGRTFTVEINGTTAGLGYDQLVVNGGVTLGGALSLSNTINPAFGTVFTVIANDGSDAVTNTFSGLAEGASLTNGGVIFTISYVGGTGNDVTLTRAVQATGVTRTWDGGGGDDNWSTAANWVGDAVPQEGDALVFPEGTPQPVPFGDLAANTAFDSITLGDGLTLSGNSLRLLNGIHSAGTNGGSFSQINQAITLLASQSINATNKYFIVSKPMDNNGNTLTVNAGATFGLTLRSNFFGSGGIVKTGAGQLVLTGTKTFTGTLTIQEGSVNPTTNNALGDSIAGTIVEAGGNLILPGTDLTHTEPLTLRGTLSDGGHPDTVVWAAPITLDGGLAQIKCNGNRKLLIPGGISGSGGVMFSGSSGVIILNGGVTHAGPTIVSNLTTLTVNGTVSVSPVLVGSGASQGFLNGNGTLANLTATLPASVVNPGTNSIGILTVTNFAVFDAAALAIDALGTNAGVGYDQLSVGGNFIATNLAQLKVTASNSLPLGVPLKIINVGGANLSTPFRNFSPAYTLAEGALITNNGVVLQISYVGGDGNDVTLTAVDYILPGTSSVWSGLGANDKWSNPTNWVGTNVPAALNNVIFPAGAPRLNPTNDLAGVMVGRIIVGGNYNLSGNSLLVLDGIDVTNSTALVGIATPLVLPRSQAFKAGIFSSLFVTNGITTTGSFMLTNAPFGTNASTTIYLGAINGPASVEVGCSVSLRATNSYTGGTFIQPGRSLFLENATLGNGAGAVTVSTNAGLYLTTDTLVNNAINLAGFISASGNNITLAGVITPIGLNAAIFGSASPPQTVLISGKLAGAAGILFDASATVTSSNNYSGQIRIFTSRQLTMQGEYPSAAIEVGLSATLAGTGTVGAITTADNTSKVSPGTSPGRLTSGNASIRPLVIELNGTNAGVDYDQLRVNGTVTLAGSLFLSNSITPPLGTVFTIIDNDGADAVSGTFTGLAEGATVVSGGVRFAVSYVGGTGNDVTLTRVYLPSGVTRVWDGGGASPDWTNAVNWVGDVAPLEGDNLSFPDAASQKINTNTFPADMHFHSIAAGGGYSLRGNPIALHAGLRSQGTNNGGVNLLTPITLATNQTFAATNSPLVFAGTVAAGGHTLTLSNALTQQITFTGDLTGNGSTIKLGAGTLNLAGTKTYDGNFILSEGITFPSTNTALGSATGSTTIAAGATLSLPNGNWTFGEPLIWGGTISEGGTTDSIIWTAPVTLTGASALMDMNTGSRIAFHNTISGSGGLTVSVGTLAINNTASHLGTTLVKSDGTLEVNGTITASPVQLGSLGFAGRLTGAGTVPTLFAGFISGVQPGTNSIGIVHVASDAAFGSGYLDLDVLGTVAGTSLDQLIVGGTLTVSNNCKLQITATNTLPIGVPLTIIECAGANFLAPFRNASPTYDLPEGSFITNNGVVLRISYTGGDGTDVTLTRAFLPSGITRTWDGGGVDSFWTTATNWVGDVAPGEGDSLYFPPAAPVTTQNNFPSSVTFNSLLFGNGYAMSSFNPLRLNGGIQVTNGNTSLNATPIQLVADQTFTIGNGTTLASAGVMDLLSYTLTVQTTVSGAGTFLGPVIGTGNIIKLGGNALTLAGSNSYSGQTIVSNGVVFVQNASALGSAAGNTLVGTNGSLNILGSFTIAEPLLLAGQFTFSGDTALTGSVQLPGPVIPLNVNSGFTGDINGVISGPGGFAKGNPGTLRLNGTNTYTGPTQIRNGTVKVNGSQPSSAVDLGSGAAPVLSGYGVIGSLTVATNVGQTAVVAPGDIGQPGTLTVTGDFLTGHAGAETNQLVVDILSGSNDVVRVTGNVTLGLNSQLILNAGLVPLGTTFTIIDNQGPNPVNGIFAGLPQNSTLTNSGFVFRISYTGGTGNDVTLTRTLNAPPSVITNATVMTNAFQITGLGEPAASYILEASTNLVNWSAIQTNSSDGSGVYFFVDTQFSVLPIRFYRVQSP